MRYDVIEKIGEGNRGEVFKVKLQNGEYAAIKWAKEYEIEKEWTILQYLNGRLAPKPIYRSKKFFIMELIEGETLKEKTKKDYYVMLKNTLISAYELDGLGVFHKQLGRYYHIFDTKDGIRFIDFERSVFSEKPRNFLQIVGYYLIRDDNFDKTLIQKYLADYYIDRKAVLNKITRMIDESIDKKI